MTSEPIGPPKAATPHRRAVHGRSKGPRLRARQQALVDTLLPTLSVTLATARAPDALFANPPEKLVLEIGFGGGEHLVHQAMSHPDTGFIGAEAYLNGFGKILSEIEAHSLKNIRLFHGDALALVAALPDGCLDRLDLLYPDPWRKRRHWKRRFVQPDTLDHVARVLKPHGAFRFASDWSDYVTWTLMQMRGRADVQWWADRAVDWREPWPNWPGTRYEAKARREGRVPTYLTFRRVP